MNYLRIYNNLILRANSRSITGYTEMHHIIPRCMGGTDDKLNLVKLTPEEHFTAHLLLMKIYPGNHKLVYAAVMMTIYSKSNAGRANNKLYGWLKRQLANSISIGQSGTGNSQYGTCWIYNVNEQKSIKIKMSDLDSYVLQGWLKGRKFIFDVPVKLDKKAIIKANTDLRYLDALTKSSSISGALRSLGLLTSGASYKRMKDVIRRHNLQGKFTHDYIIWK